MVSQPTRAFRLVVLVWCELALVQSAWPGDVGVICSFAGALLMVRRSSISSDEPTAGHRRHLALRCAELLSWGFAGLALQLPIASIATALFELLTGEDVGVYGAQPIHALRAISIFLLAPAFEESLYRGHLFAGLADAWSTSAAVFASAACFALPHADALHVGATFLAGLALGVLRARTRRVEPCIAMHIGLNVAAAAPETFPIWRFIE